MKRKQKQKADPLKYTMTAGYKHYYPKTRDTQKFRDLVQEAIDRMWDEIVDKSCDIEVADIARRGALDALSGPTKRCKPEFSSGESYCLRFSEMPSFFVQPVEKGSSADILIGAGALKSFRKPSRKKRCTK
jgi:hypothetical protein